MNWYRFWKSGTQRRPLRHPTQQRSLWWHALFYLNKLLAGGLNQANTVPFTPKRLESRDISIAWSSVSNAAERSNKSNMVVLLWSKEHKMWFCTLSSAVSVEWNSLYADWNVSSRWLVITCFVSWTATDFSTSLEINFKFEIGRKFVNCLKSAVGFFNVGEREAIFRASGIKPVVNDKLTILVIVGRSTEKQSLSTDGCRGSRQQDLLKGL